MSGGHAVDRSKPAALERGNGAPRGNPDAPGPILKDGLHGIIRQATLALAIDRNAPVAPSVQAITGAQPHAAIPRRQDGPYERIGQPLLHGNRGDGDLAKTIEAATGRDPDIAFTILEQTVDEIAGETVRPGKDIRSAPMHMQDPMVGRSDPQTAGAIPEEPKRLKLPCGARERVGLGFSVNELSDFVANGNQESPVVTFGQRAHAVRHRIERRRPRLPSPHSGGGSCPESAAAVLMQGDHFAAELPSCP